MFIDFSPEKSLTLKQKLWKALKSGTNHLYTTNIHGRGVQTRTTFWLRDAVAGKPSRCGASASSSAELASHRGAPQLAATHGHTHTAGSRHSLTAGHRATHCQHRLSVLECIRSRTPPWSCKRIPAGRSLTALGARGGPARHHQAAGLSCEPPSSSFYGFFFFFLMWLFNLSSWYGRIDFCLVWLQWHP